MTAEGGRQTFDTLWQPSACGDKTSRLEALYHDLIERLVQVENEINKKRVWSESVDTRLQFLESCHRQHAISDHDKRQETSNPDPPYQEGHRSYQEAFPGGLTQKELQEKEEYKKLKEKIKDLEARNKELLSKVMGMHKHSENMNDPLRLSAVLQMYEMLRLREWEKLRSSTASYLSYKTGSSIIKKLFDACEKDIQQRTRNIFEVLDIPPSNDAMTDSKQGMMQEIRNIFRCSYYQNHSEFYSKIVMQADVDPKTAIQRQFTLQCCKIYCLLLLQDPPVKAVWNLQETLQYLEHVDKKDWEHWRKPAFLWPIMKCGEQVIVKGVVWDEK
ncbi:uncharacterized protein LOC127024942 [Gymnogyps californianus]|uniref:uncharacterized protein LOC127024942 n=1 Tax=Gymnogyps californianus TaxID=33616 RepID=UPI0021C99BDA|nr:uncharacterized protein LOC127024942 [Gymnogyps californianus]